jgi:hypothetical protein
LIILFQILDLQSDRGLGQVELLGRSAKTGVFGHFTKDPKLMHVHEESPHPKVLLIDIIKINELTYNSLPAI